MTPLPTQPSYAELFENLGTIAMVGASTRSNKASYFVMTYLLAKGLRVIPVNPAAAGREILEQKVYPSLADIPEPIDCVNIFRHAEAAHGIVEEVLALKNPPRLIWMQFGVTHEAAAKRARDAGLTVVMDRCLKEEWARLRGELGWIGLNSGQITSKLHSKKG